MTRAEFDAIINEIAESDITARDFRLVNEILQQYVGDKHGDDCTDSAD